MKDSDIIKFGVAQFEIYNKKYWARPENNFIARTASQKLRDFFNNKKSF